MNFSKYISKCLSNLAEGFEFGTKYLSMMAAESAASQSNGRLAFTLISSSIVKFQKDLRGFIEEIMAGHKKGIGELDRNYIEAGIKNLNFRVSEFKKVVRALKIPKARIETALGDKYRFYLEINKISFSKIQTVLSGTIFYFG